MVMTLQFQTFLRQLNTAHEINRRDNSVASLLLVSSRTYWIDWVTADTAPYASGPGAGVRMGGMLLAVGGRGLCSGNYADLLFQSQHLKTPLSNKPSEKPPLPQKVIFKFGPICYFSRWPKMVNTHTQRLLTLETSEDSKTQYQPNSQRIQKVCLLWYSQQDRALRTLG